MKYPYSVAYVFGGSLKHAVKNPWSVAYVFGGSLKHAVKNPWSVAYVFGGSLKHALYFLLLKSTCIKVYFCLLSR